ncbi:MAG: hypothetical protein ACYTFH_00730 [Planctomycetota bacterium]|jgi:hypothetical protein
MPEDHDDGGRGPKPIARCLGEAVGHLVSAVRRPVAPTRHLVDRRSEVREHDGLRLRRTVIDEIETPRPAAPSPTRTPRGTDRA